MTARLPRLVRSRAFWDPPLGASGKGENRSPVQVRAVAEGGLVAIASGPRDVAERAMEALRAAPKGESSRALWAAIENCPTSTEVVALLFREGGASMAQRGQHRAFAFRDNRALLLTGDQSMADDPSIHPRVEEDRLEWDFTPDFNAAADARAALSAEQMALLRAQPHGNLEVRSLEAVPGTWYLLVSHTVYRALGSDVIWELVGSGAGPEGLVQAARAAHPAQRRGMGAAMVLLSE